MKISKQTLLSLIVLGLLAAGCSSFSLAEDITPPPDYVTPTTVPTIDAAAIAPSQALDPARGQLVYMEKCAACHGGLGMGDGTQAAKLPVTVPALASPEEIRPSRPVDWFMVVTNGRMDKFMPGFDSLDTQQKWDALAYVYSLGAAPDVLSEGKDIYTAQCASCHGPEGKGDGNKLSDWSKPASLAGLSIKDMMDITAAGKGGMPPFADKLSEDQQFAVASYIRQLGFTPASKEAQAAPANPTETASPDQTETTAASTTETPPAAGATEVAAAPAFATISGAVTNASGGTLPTGLKAVLEGYDAMQPSLTLEAEVGPDGSFKWDGVEALESRVYLVSVAYGGITFRSPVIHGKDMKSGAIVAAPVEIYDTTHDTAGLTVERMHVFFDFPSAGRVQVVQMFLITNPGKKLIVPTAVDKPLLAFSLPAGYENLQFQDGQIGDRYIQTAAGFGDTADIFPGNSNHQVLFAYELPYDKSATIPLSMPLNVANAIFMVPQDGVSLSGQGLQDGGERTLQEGTLHLYSTSNLPAGSTLELSLSGRPGQTPAIATGPIPGLLIGGGVLVLALIGAAFWFMTRRETDDTDNEVEEVEGESVDSLLDAIVALDDLYKAGKLPKAAYEERRTELKERLRVVKGDQASHGG